jgi:rhodanese-related sulfurtransferase
MKRRVALVTLALPLLLLAAPGPAAPDEAEARRLPLDEAKKALDEGRIVLLDVRAVEAYRNGHIPGALSIPLDDVAAKAGELKKTGKRIVAYCA